MRLLVLPLLTLALALPVFAVDGVLEISQACAETTGCFAGDGVGFPVEITAGGSYVLTSDLQLAVDLDAVSIDASPVTLDLNGK